MNVGMTGEGIVLEIDSRQVRNIQKAFDTLGKRLVNKIIKRETRPFSKKITDAVKANAPLKTGFLKRNIKTRVAKNENGSQFKVIGTATTTSKGFYKGDDFYAGFQEFGWHVGKRTRTKSDADRKFIPGKEFFGKAAKDPGLEMLQRASYAISKALDAEAEKVFAQNKEKLLAIAGIKK